MQLTMEELKQLVAAESGHKNHSFTVGEKYFIRTVTLYYTGRLVAVTDSDLVLEYAAWIADTGRFSDFLKSGDAREIEPYPDNLAIIVPRGGIIDACIWCHDLPRVQK